MHIGLRIKELRKEKKITQKDLSNAVKVDSSQFSKIEQGKAQPTLTQLMDLSSILDTTTDWLLTGNIDSIEDNNEKRNLIPFYDDVESIGGNNYAAEMQGISQTTEYIDAGDWFPNVSAAIRHYNDSMLEYPSGCILALKKINEVQSIVWGSNYVIETTEMRITKRMQTSDDDAYVMAYSTNTETYPDGKQIHEPKKILKTDIKNIFLVLGRIVKEHSSGPIYAKNKGKNY